MTSARDVFDEGNRAYAELAAVLDADSGRVLHGEGGAAWTARDVYVHLFRWQRWAVDALAHSLETGELVEAYADESEMEALNARWQVQGGDLSLAAAKALCEQARESMQEAFSALSDADWARWGTEYGAEFDGSHYHGHLAYIPGAG